METVIRKGKKEVTCACACACGGEGTSSNVRTILPQTVLCRVKVFDLRNLCKQNARRTRVGIFFVGLPFLPTRSVNSGCQ